MPSHWGPNLVFDGTYVVDFQINTKQGGPEDHIQDFQFYLIGRRIKSF